MKKMMKKISVLLLTFVMITGVIGPVSAFAEGETPEVEPTVAGLAIPYGVYEPTTTLLYESPRGLKITCERVHVTNKFRAEITFSSAKYTRVVVNEVEYEPYVDETAGTTTFIIPVSINKPMTITGTTVAMGGNPTDIDYTITVSLDKDALTKASYKTLQDGFYTTEVSSDLKTYGHVVNTDGTVTYGFSNPKKDYLLPVTIQVADGKIVDVAYTKEITDIMNSETMGSTGSDMNYLLWAMDGEYVTDATYNYMKKSKTSQYNKYNIDPYPAKNGTGLKDQIVAKNSIVDVDTVTKATITSRAIIDSVDQSLVKAERGQKDDPDPVLPKPDTSEDVIPEDGVYSVKGKCIGADLGNDEEIMIEVKDGKMTAKLMYIEQRQSSYPHIYAGIWEEAVADESGWLKPVDYDYDYYTSSGTYAPGSLYKDVPLKSLNKQLRFVMYASSSSAWYNRLIKLDSATLKKLSQAEIDLKNAQAELLVSEATLKTAEQTLQKALDKEDATAEELKTAADAYATAAKDASAKSAVVTEKAGAVEAEAQQAAQQAAAEEIEAAKKEAEAAKKEAEAAKKEAEDAKKEAEAAETQAEDVNKQIEELKIKTKQVKSVKAKAGKKKATVTWKSLGKGFKYQVYVSTKVGSGFKKKATSAKLKTVVKKLKSKKTYYVRVRGFKKVNGKTVYTAFSDLAQVKVK